MSELVSELGIYLFTDRLSALLVESWVPMRGRLGLGDERLRAGREGTRACP